MKLSTFVTLAICPFPLLGQNGSPEDAIFQTLPIVEGAALHAQTLEEAPANVTVITADEIRKYGYRTLAEALQSVRGFYVTYDHMYHYVGVRGFSLPGDFNTRFLVMLNGHPLTEIIYSSNGFFGQDFGIDMDLVERIEIIRGPTSALYGSNGIFANINIVTRSPVDSHKWRLSTETGNFGEKKAEGSASLYLGRGANLLVSGSVFNNTGQDLYIPQFDTSANNDGWARNADGERGYHVFANLIWRNWSFTALLSSRWKQAPVPWSGEALFADPGSFVVDATNRIGASYTRDIGASAKLRWQTWFEQYHYEDRFDYDYDSDSTVEDVRTKGAGDWIDSELTYTVPTGRNNAITVGLSGSFEIRNMQHEFVNFPVHQDLVDVSKPDRQAAVFAQEEWAFATKWKAYIGVRYDYSANRMDALSPRVAIVYEPHSGTSWKLVYGRPFRNPSAMEQYLGDYLTLLPAPQLRPETAQTLEVSYERRFRKNWTVIATAYQYRMYDLIRAVSPTGLPPAQYQNSDYARATGMEAELDGKLRGGLEITASAAFQATDLANEHQEPANSPGYIDKLRAGMPFLRGKLFVSGAATYLSSRLSNSGTQTGAVALADFTITTIRLHPDFDLQAGIRNAFNYRYDDPVSLSTDRMPEAGRTVYLKPIWHSRE